jgi:hypothetical protein
MREETRLCAARYQDRSNRTCGDSWKQFATAIKVARNCSEYIFEFFNRIGRTATINDQAARGQQRSLK